MVVNVRPTEINLEFYPGNPVTLVFNFPAGWLSTRTMATYLNGNLSGGTEGSAIESTDTLTVSFTGSQTDNYDWPTAWTLANIASGYEVIFAGTWSPGTDPTPSPTIQTFNVSLSPDAVVNVTAIASVPALVYVNHGNSTATLAIAGVVATETYYRVVLNAATVTMSITGATANIPMSIRLILAQDATGGRLVTWPTTTRTPGGITPALSTAANAVDHFLISSVDGGTNWDLVPIGYEFEAI